MSTISGYDSSSIGVLFSSLNTGRTKTTFAASDLLNINYNDYATIRNGSYTKLLKAYYAKEESGESGESAIGSTSTSKDSTALLARIESASDDLSNAADKLRKNGNGSLFRKEQVTDEKGNVSYGYNTDKIYKAVSEFADSYNHMIEEGADSNTKSILRATKSLVNLTKANANLLGKVGITIGTDNKLSVDEAVFKKADMDTVKSLFHSTGGYGYQTEVQAGMIQNYAKAEAEKANTYGKTGMYTYNYATGTLYNTTT